MKIDLTRKKWLPVRLEEPARVIVTWKVGGRAGAF